MATKHKVVITTNKEEFERQLDEIAEEYGTFATQSRITSEGFTALCFCKGEKKE